MSIDRRTLLGAASASAAGTALATRATAAPSPSRVRKIATEEAFATAELAAAWLDVARNTPAASLDVPTGILSIFNSPAAGPNQDRFRRQLLDFTPIQRTSICHANAERIFRIAPA